MAKTNTTATQASQPTATRGRGRPPKDSADARDPVEVALSNLKYATERACAFTNDGATSIAARAAQAARRGVPRATVEKCLDYIRAALGDAEDAMERAYAAPQEKERPASRVVL